MKIPSTMKGPGDFRPGIWLGRVLQIKVTNVCDLDCNNCSVGVGLARKLKKTFHMTPKQFRAACQSLKGFPGVVGMFGGNPCLHPQFEELCEIFRQEVPDQHQRGLWSNRLFGKGAVCRKTFSPIHSNLNVHGSVAAYREIQRDWPEARVLEAGLGMSRHGPIFGAPQDLGYGEAEMWEAVGKCYVNQTWSAEITVVNGGLAAYYCEIAGTMAELTGDDSFAVGVVPGWWKHNIYYFEHQVRQYCPRCLVPMNPRKVYDSDRGAAEQYTEVWKPVMLQVNGRRMEQAFCSQDVVGVEPATKYLEKGVMPSVP